MTSKLNYKTLLLGSALVTMFALGAISVGYGNAQGNGDKSNIEKGNVQQASLAQQSSSLPPRDIETQALDTEFSSTQEDDIRDIVRAYLLDNPEVLVEAIGIYEQRRAFASVEQARQGAAKNFSALISEENGFVTGAPIETAKVAVVELFDYHCGFCKQASGLVQDLANDDKDILVAFREFPILRRESETAAEAALAARNQGKYIDFHFAMMNAKGTLSRDRINAIAKEENLDLAALSADMEKSNVGTAIRETIAIAQEMGVSGTPSFVVASMDGNYIQVINGYKPDEVLSSIEAAKASYQE